MTLLGGYEAPGCEGRGEEYADDQSGTAGQHGRPCSPRASLRSTWSAAVRTNGRVRYPDAFPQELDARAAPPSQALGHHLTTLLVTLPA
jgi:hypothetical protein